MPIEKEDHYVQTFMGTDYNIGNPKTVKALKAKLEEIITDLPEDKEGKLEIAEIDLRDGKLSYLLNKGIVQ